MRDWKGDHFRSLLSEIAISPRMNSHWLTASCSLINAWKYHTHLTVFFKVNTSWRKKTQNPFLLYFFVCARMDTHHIPLYINAGGNNLLNLFLLVFTPLKIGVKYRLCFCSLQEAWMAIISLMFVLKLTETLFRDPFRSCSMCVRQGANLKRRKMSLRTPLSWGMVFHLWWKKESEASEKKVNNIHWKGQQNDRQKTCFSIDRPSNIPLFPTTLPFSPLSPFPLPKKKRAQR